MADRWQAADGTPLGHAAALERLAEARAILLGETHDRAADHRWQAAVLAGLAGRGDGLAIGFEMFPRQAQPVLDTWVAGGLAPDRFLAGVRWPEVWGFSPALYMPLFDLCRDLGLPMIALNVDRPIVSLVGRDGWDALPEAERGWLSPAAPATADHRAYLFAMTGGARPDRTAQGPLDPAFDRFARAQGVWDRAFACAIAGALASGARQVAAVIGRGHLEYGFGTPAQLADLGVAPVRVALPATAGSAPVPGPGSIADLVFRHPDPEESRA